jgi:hypothetical protein
LIAPHWLSWITGAVFIVFGLWALHPDSLDDDPKLHPAGAFVTAAIAFFIAEMGDKTQFATVALGAQFQGALFAVVMGTTLGMMLANVPRRADRRETRRAPALELHPLARRRRVHRHRRGDHARSIRNSRLTRAKPGRAFPPHGGAWFR